MKFQTPLEFFEILSNPHKWQFFTVLGVIGLIGSLGSISYFTLAGKLPPRLVWNGFALTLLTGSVGEIVQIAKNRKTTT